MYFDSAQCKQKGFAPIIILVGVLVIGSGIVGAWYLKIIQIPNFPPPGCYYQKVQCIKAPCNPILVCDTLLPTSISTSQTSKQASTDEIANPVNGGANWETYINEKLGIEFKYPEIFQITKDNAQEIVLSGSNGESLQILTTNLLDYNNLISCDHKKYPCLEDYSVKSAELANRSAMSYYGHLSAENGYFHAIQATHNPQIEFRIILSADKSASENLFKQILSTLVFINKSQTSNLLKTYNDAANSFTLQYPDYVVYDENFHDPDQLQVGVLVHDITKLAGGSGYDFETAKQDIKALSKGEYGEAVDWALASSRQIVKVGNLYAKSFMVLSRFQVCPVEFERRLIFYLNNKQIIIILTAPSESITSSMPTYFQDDEYCPGKIWSSRDFSNQRDDFYETLKKGQGSTQAQKWFDTFDEIIETIKIK